MKIRLAIEVDIPDIRELIEKSVRGLQAQDYTQSQIDNALKTAYGVDTQLIKDQTYFIVEEEGSIIGCGGWSKRKTLCGSDAFQNRDDSLLNPAIDAAKIRAFYVHPAQARKGIGTLILERCEEAAQEAGFLRLEMAATLTGIPFYKRRGYVQLENLEAALSGGEVLPMIRMEKLFTERQTR